MPRLSHRAGGPVWDWGPPAREREAQCVAATSAAPAARQVWALLVSASTCTGQRDGLSFGA